MQIKNKILAITLSFLMLFTNIINVFGYEWDLEVPLITNSSNDIVSNETNSIDNTVIINGEVKEQSSNITQNQNTKNETTNIVKNNSKTDNKILKETFSEKTGKTVTVPITRSIELKETKGAKTTITLVGGDKGATASVAFKGDEPNATQHAIIDYITRENNDPNAVSYCISPFYAGAKENFSTTVTIDPNLTATDKQLLGIAVAGYPYNKYNVAGYDALKEEDKYYATLIAMEHLIFQKTGEYKNKKGVVFNGDHWNSTRWYPVKTGDTNAQNIINVEKRAYPQ